MADSLHHAEERIAHLERSVDELSDELARQGRQMALLERQLRLLMEREADRAADTDPGVPLADQRPPHW